METVILGITFLYLLSSAGYLSYLFLQKDSLQYFSGCILLLAFIGHTSALGYDFFLAGLIPVRNLHEALSMAAWTISGVYILFQYRFNLKVLGAFAVPLASLVMVASELLPDSATVVQNSFRSIWLVFHILTVFVGEAAFALACGIGILYLFQENAIKTKKRSFFYKRLPSLELLDASGYTCIVAGFTLLTIGLATGFIYAKLIWGKFLSWDPKEIWSAITWLIYAALIHERLTVGWRGRKAAILAIIGFCVAIFTFLGVNLLLKGHHGLFTRW
jgi:cytochrome c-type biogenesis protein CcsB